MKQTPRESRFFGKSCSTGHRNIVSQLTVETLRITNLWNKDSLCPERLSGPRQPSMGMGCLHTGMDEVLIFM